MSFLYLLTHSFRSYLVLFCFFCLLAIFVSFSLSEPLSNTALHDRDPTKLDIHTYCLSRVQKMAMTKTKTGPGCSFLAKLPILYSEAFYNLEKIHHFKIVFISISPSQGSCVKNQTHDGTPWLYRELVVAEMYLCRNSYSKKTQGYILPVRGILRYVCKVKAVTSW